MNSYTYAEALERLAALGPEMRMVRAADGTMVPRKFSLDAVRLLLSELGDPQNAFRSVLIAGTNGKGSTASTLASIVAAAGIRTGLYTSPHLLRINERIQMSTPGGLAPIEDGIFAQHFQAVERAAESLVERGVLPHMPSHFEIVTALGFVAFRAAGVELAIVEVGLGGRLDATNTVEPLVSIITDIGMDHMEFLGHTLTAIAREKAGILRQNGVLVMLAQHPEVNAAVGEHAVALDVRGVDASRCLPPRTDLESNLPSDGLLRANRYPLSIDGQVLQVDSPLAGRHQQRNLALAIAAALELRSNHGFAIPNAAIESGIRKTRWPGRLEWVRRENSATLLLDVAHNPAGAWTLRAAIAELPQQLPRTLVFSCLADKPLEELAQILFPLFDASSSDPERSNDHILFAPMRSPRAASVESLLACAEKMEIPARAAATVVEALDYARAATPIEGIIVVTGSLFLVAEAMEVLEKATTV